VLLSHVKSSKGSKFLSLSIIQVSAISSHIGRRTKVVMFRPVMNLRMGKPFFF